MNQGGLLSAVPFWMALLFVTALPCEGAESKEHLATKLELFSTDAYRMEVRHLSRKLDEIDLAGPPIITDGWSTNIVEAEWPFLGAVYFGHACLNLLEANPGLRNEMLPQARWVLHALQTPRLSGFVEQHFSEPFPRRDATRNLPLIEKPATFLHGHFLYLATRYRSITGDARFDPVIRQVAESLYRAIRTSSHGLLKSYGDMWWLTDNFAAYAGLLPYDREIGTAFSQVSERLVEHIRSNYLDPATGLFATYVNDDVGTILQGPRGISVMYGLHFLRVFAPEFAEEHYSLAKRHFYRSLLGAGAVLEFPAGSIGPADVDSGPVIAGLGPSASGFAVGAAAIMKDQKTLEELLRSIRLVGLPVIDGDGLSYMSMPMVGQAVILFGKTAALQRVVGSDSSP